MATSTIDQECDLIEKSASELRETISQIEDGEFDFKEKSVIIFQLIDEIKETKENIVSLYDELDSEFEKAKDKIEEMEEEEAATLAHEIPHTSISYECSDFADTEIMEALTNCLHVSSGVNKRNLLNILESLPTNIAFKRA